MSRRGIMAATEAGLEVKTHQTTLFGGLRSLGISTEPELSQIPPQNSTRKMRRSSAPENNHRGRALYKTCGRPLNSIPSPRCFSAASKNSQTKTKKPAKAGHFDETISCDGSRLAQFKSLKLNAGLGDDRRAFVVAADPVHSAGSLVAHHTGHFHDRVALGAGFFGV